MPSLMKGGSVHGASAASNDLSLRTAGAVPLRVDTNLHSGREAEPTLDSRSRGKRALDVLHGMGLRAIFPRLCRD